jgi:FixJ family two-component response regulator
MPIIFITGHGNISMTVKAMKSGAIDFLEKPFQDKDLFEAVQNAIEKDQSARASKNSNTKLRHKIYLLTPREYEVLTFVITGLPNKAIAVELGASEKTIKVHRGRLMHKIEASSIVELIRLADKAGIQPAITTT